MKMASFSDWLTDKLEKSGITVNTLAKRLNVSYSTILKIKKGQRNPSRKLVISIGDFFRATQEALLSAGYVTDISYPSLQIEFQPRQFFKDTFLVWLQQRRLLTEKTANFLDLIFYKSLSWARENLVYLKIYEEKFVEVFSEALRKVHTDDDNDARESINIALSKSIFKLSDFPNPKILIDDTERKLFEDDLRIFMSLGIISPSEFRNAFELLGPVPLFPIMMLRIFLSEEYSKEIFNRVKADYPLVNNSLKEEDYNKIQLFFKNTDKNMHNIDIKEQDIHWLTAKVYSVSLWNQFPCYKFDILKDPYRYYDEAKLLYQGNNEVIIFSTTPGLILPEEYFGSYIIQKLKIDIEHSGKKDIEELKLKNPFRYLYFRFGIEHGLKFDCSIKYQFDLHTTANRLSNTYKLMKRIGKDSIYKDLAISQLNDFLKYRHLELRASCFDSLDNVPVYLDWRKNLTLVENGFSILSVRTEQEKKRVHGVIVRTDFFDRSIPSYVKDHLSTSSISATTLTKKLALYLFEKGKIEHIINTHLKKRDAKAVINSLLEIGKAT